MADPRDEHRSHLPLVLLFAVLVTLVAYGIWRLKHTILVRHVLIWKAYELWPIAVVSDYGRQLQGVLGTYYHYANVLMVQEVFALGWKIGLFYSPLPVAFGLWAAYRAISHPVVKAVRVHTIQSLLEAQSKDFPAIAPILFRDLTNDTSPEWRSSIHPEEWVVEHGLIVDERLDIDRTRRQFVAQLGSPIKSVMDLKPHERALFAAFALRVFFKAKKESDDLIDAINRSAANKTSTPDLTLANKAFARCARHSDTKQWVAKHRFPATLLMGLLIESREFGTLPSSHFLWLKPLDRKLWYPLNTAGRKVPFVESAGAFNQLNAETVAWEAGFMLTEPHVEEALAGLQKYLEEVGILEASTDYTLIKAHI